MKATTVGSGPFKPAIQYGAYTWVSGVELPNEMEAFAVAQQVVNEIEESAIQIMTANGMVRQE